MSRREAKFAMSAVTQTRRINIPDIRRRKDGQPLVCLTAYTTPVARILDATCDLLLVGDSLGMVVYGLETTLGVTLDMMIAHGAAVRRGVQRACVVVDMPFGSYQASREDAFRAAARVMAETGCDGVKLEGGAEMADTVRFLVERGIPVMGHVGLMPQQVNVAGGYRSHGKEVTEREKIVYDARAIAGAGAFSVVVEGTVESLAREITEQIEVPTIGIGASAACDGQILVVDDMLGLFTDFTPKFVKRYANLAGAVHTAAEAYANDVRERRFPGPEHCFGVPRAVRAVSG